MNKGNLSIVVPVLNEEGNVIPLTEQIHSALVKAGIEYELIFIDDHSTDNTIKNLRILSNSYPVRIFIKQGEKGKAQSLLEGFSKARFDTIAMIDADLQYPPEALPAMFRNIEGGADIVVANRNETNISLQRKLLSQSFKLLFGRFLHNLSYDVQSGLKMFRKEIIKRVTLHPSPWTFDLEFLTKARSAGYKIDGVDIQFARRHWGQPKIGLLQASWEIGWSAIKLAAKGTPIIPFSPEMEKVKGKGFHYKGQEFIHHGNLTSKDSAFYRMSRKQSLVFLLIGLFILASFLANWHLTIIIFVALLSALYFTDLLFNFYLIYRSFARPPEYIISAKEMDAVKPKDWPTYTILCPLYKEHEVLSQFVSAINGLDYPKNKLQVILLLEEDDKLTIEKAKEFGLPKHFQIEVIPHSIPKTKPKALNFGLKYTTGEYTVIYDAEDVPDPKQLKKAVLAFQKAGNNTVCIQAKLNFYNPYQNILTRVFTAEYSLWFDLVLTGLQSIHAPIPLGGTSNHFRTKDLHLVKGWDAFNVTEDCDLGMRLVKLGYQTAVLDSTTMEEANSDLPNWFRQRTRWIKGYIQTYLVHMRRPGEFISDWKKPHVITFQLIIGGKVMSMFINPFMWMVTITYFALRPIVGTFIESLFPGPVFYMAVFSLIFGNFLYVYYYMIGCAKREQWGIIKYVFIVPFYWLAMSVSSWMAVYQIFRKPHFWPKTVHGYHLNKEKKQDRPKKLLGKDLTDHSTLYPMEVTPAYAKKAETHAENLD